MIWEVVVLGKQCSFLIIFKKVNKIDNRFEVGISGASIFRTENNFSENLQENEEFLSCFKCVPMTRTAIYLIISCFRMKNDRDTRSTSPLEEKKNVKNTEDTNKKLKNFQNAIKIGTSKE